MMSTTKAETAHITPIHTNAEWRYSGFCPFCREGIKAFQRQRQLSPVQQHAEVKAQGPTSQNQRPPLQLPRGNFKRGGQADRCPLLPSSDLGHRSQGLRSLWSLGWEPRLLDCCQAGFFLWAWLLLKALYSSVNASLMPDFFFKILPFPCPQIMEAMTHPFGKLKWKWINTFIHISSVSNDSFEKHPTSCIWLTSGLRRP